MPSSTKPPGNQVQSWQTTAGKRRLLGRLFLVILLALATTLITLPHPGGPAWLLVKYAVRREFPAVGHISTDELARRLAGPNPPLVVDAREPQEYALSRIPGAVPWPVELPRDREMVVYCSVGYRSAALAARIGAQNLEGSLFAWANEGRPLEGGSTVHPFGVPWSLLLRPSLRGEPSPGAEG